MRTSCNGCRVLRKGCSDDCTIRPCLQWIKSADSQANATVFLAKFYGRAGLLNLLNAGPPPVRPAVFKSLLYEACGRVVDPVYGSVGLMWSGQWNHCQAAVEAVLKGLPIMQLHLDHHAPAPDPFPAPLKLYDIRHVSTKNSAASTIVHEGFHRLQTRTLFKRKAARPSVDKIGEEEEEEWRNDDDVDDDDEAEESVETVEASVADRVNHVHNPNTKSNAQTGDHQLDEVRLELSLALDCH
ncbi:hypothetical protein Nepgr_003737 [Nepenthes gracilis]|uniref:LOB domain-containing protein n=1 Tax=Nepenthes gracilis TaxID=150966 RepID=A0AAD3S025_NEPGR|nr:hypothetical protein Nepgr_003737 [Nepenthes gracilis]